MSILLVTGSRSLAKIEGAREWVLGILSAHVGLVREIVTGDASGPDTWAAQLATNRTPAVVYEAQSGKCVYLPSGLRAHRPAWSDRYPDFFTTSGKARPPMRNRAMVDDLVAQPSDFVVVHAFIDPTSKTGGTKMTADYANKRGLWVAEHKWGVK